LTRISAGAAVASVFIDYLAGFWPQAKGPATRFVILTVLIGGLAAANIRGVGWNVGQQLFHRRQVAALVILVVGGLLFVHVHGSPVPPVDESHPAGAWMNAVLLLIFAYGGFEAALIPAEKSECGSWSSVALMAAWAIVTTVFFLVQVVVVRMLTNPAQTGRPLRRQRRFRGSSMATIISMGALLSTFGYFAATMIATPRITFAFAEQGDFPAGLPPSTSATKHRTSRLLPLPFCSGRSH